MVAIRTDGSEFDQDKFIEYYDKNGISHNFLAPRTPQQNGVVESKNRTLADIAKTLICENDLPKSLRVEAINTTNYVLNKCLIRPILKKMSYELLKGKNPNVSYFNTFGNKCFIYNNGKENLGKFDPRSDKGIFVGYSSASKVYRVYNKRTKVSEESVDVALDETNDAVASSSSFDELQLSKYVDDEDEGAVDKSNH